MTPSDEPQPDPKVGEAWESFRHYKGKVTSVENGQVTWEPTTWLGRKNTYGLSTFLQLFSRMDEPQE